MHRDGPDGTLHTAAALAALEAVVLIVAVIVNARPGAPLYVAVLGAKLPFCALVRRRSAGAFLALLLYEVAGLVGALLAPGVRLELRLVELALAGTVFGLLLASVRLFPAPELPHQP